MSKIQWIFKVNIGSDYIFVDKHVLELYKCFRPMKEKSTFNNIMSIYAALNEVTNQNGTVPKYLLDYEDHPIFILFYKLEMIAIIQVHKTLSELFIAVFDDRWCVLPPGNVKIFQLPSLAKRGLVNKTKTTLIAQDSPITLLYM